MAGLVQYSRFYVEHGIRNIGQLMTLRKNEVTSFIYPLNTTLHFGVRDIGEIGLPQEDELFANAGNRILTNYVGMYQHPLVIGKPLKLQRIMLKEVKKFLGKNKKFKFIDHSRSWLDMPAVPYIINYSSIDRTYRYKSQEGADFWRRTNFFATVIHGIVKELNTTNRNQFMYFDVPTLLPGLNRLEEAENQMLKNGESDLPLDRRLRTMFGSDGAFVLLQFWLWAGENRHLSLFSQIPDDKLDRVTFMTTLDGRYTVLNLGTFRKWIRDEVNPKGALSHRRAQRAILRHFMAIQQIATVSDDTIIVDTDSVADRENIEKSMTMTIDETKLQNLVGDDREYISEAPADPKLDLDIDTSAFKRDKEVVLDAKARLVDQDPVSNDASDVEDYLLDQMDRDLQQHSVTAAQNEVEQLVESEDVYRSYVPKERTMTTKINDMTDNLASKGLLSSAEVRRIKGLGERYLKVKSPYDDSQTIAEYMQIDPASLAIGLDTRLTEKDIKGIVDPSMLSYSIQDFDSRYISDVMGKDVVNAFMHFQNAGIAVTDVGRKRVDEYLGSYEILSVQLTPVVGKPSTVKIKLPIVDRNGIFVANGVKYRMKKQRVDAPIRKVSHDRVALTSYMSKMFVSRTTRVAFNYGDWIVNRINLLALDVKSGLSEVRQGDVFDQTVKLPLTYTSVARQIIGFQFGGVKFYFDYNNIERNFPAEILSKIDLTKHIPIAVKMQGGTQQVLAFNQNDKIQLIDLNSMTIREVGTLAQMLGLNRENEPVNYAEATLLGNDIPIGMLLSYQVGFGNLLKTTGVKYRREKRGHGVVIEDNEFALTFEDEILIFDRNDQKACLIFNGFNRIKAAIRRISVYSLDKQESYSALVKALQIPLNHLKQYTNIFDVWVDHITRDLLIDMDEPTDMVLLFLSAVDKLCEDAYKDPNGVNESILRGYQRISGMVYAELHRSVRAYVNNPMSKNAVVELNPKAVWFKITQDQTVAPIEESNPIHAIKEKEVVVFRGDGGRDADTMTAKHRQFVRDSVGIISEANVDNGQVGTIAYLTADPNIVNLRGVTKPIEDLANVPKTKVQSTAMLLSPGSDTDDSKRVTFTNVMFTSTSFLYKATPNRLLTGAERTVAFRTDDIWARNAKQGGKVTELTKESMTVQYADGSLESFPVGRYFGTWSGTIVPHEISTQLKVGDIFDKDDIICYNAHYFQPDNLNPKHVIFKRGIRGNMLLWEAVDTLEDADSISKDFSKRLVTGTTEKRRVKVPADHDFEFLCEEGKHVDPETILCTLRPPMSGMSSHYNQDALDALDALNTLTPKAKYEGVIERIEVMYTGELDDMSPSLQEIVTKYDSKLYRLNKKLGIPVLAAKIDPNYSIENVDVGENQVVVTFYITEEVGAGIGDKLVFGNQMKSIISNVVEKPYIAEDGTVVDITFSRQSVANRIVNSIDLIGTSNTVLSLIEKEAIELWLN